MASVPEICYDVHTHDHLIAAEKGDCGRKTCRSTIGKSGSGCLSGKPWKAYFHGIEGGAFLEHELVAEIAQREASGLAVRIQRQALERVREMSPPRSGRDL